MATLGNPVNATTVGQLLVNLSANLVGQYHYLKHASDVLTQSVGTTNLQTAAGITDSNEVFQCNSMLAAVNGLIACYENSLAQPGFNIAQFCDIIAGTQV